MMLFLIYINNIWRYNNQLIHQMIYNVIYDFQLLMSYCPENFKF